MELQVFVIKASGKEGYCIGIAVVAAPDEYTARSLANEAREEDCSVDYHNTVHDFNGLTPCVEILPVQYHGLPSVLSHTEVDAG